MLNITAQQAFNLYQDALDHDWLRQGQWNVEEDGRRIACALGILDPSISSASQCPTSVMPAWLSRMVPWLFDGQTKEDAFAWGKKFYEQLSRLDGKVPFTIIYDWHANYSWAMGIEAFEKLGKDTTSQKAIQELHRRALNGDRASHDEWYKAFKNADAYADAYAYAYANARKKAIARLAMGLIECLARVN